MITGEITCDKCKKSWPLDLVLMPTHVQSRVPTLPVMFEVIEKRFNATDPMKNPTFKKFHVCGSCIDDHRRQADLLFDQHFRNLK